MGTVSGGKATPPGTFMTLDRRTFVGGAASFGALAVGTALPSPSEAKRSPVAFVVVDRRIRESEQFALPFEHGGAEALQVTDGLTALWRNRLLPHWQGGPGAVVGLTAISVWDGLSQQSLGQFRKPRLLGTHHLGANASQNIHKMRLSALQAGEHHARFAHNHWAAHLAETIRTCAPSRPIDEPCVFGNPRSFASATTHLVSWMIV